MTYLRISPCTVTAANHKNLIAAWKIYGDSPLVASFRCENSPTQSQLSRIPAGLRARLVIGPEVVIAKR